jgi:PTS system nitrogen regulatory IIA component
MNQLASLLPLSNVVVDVHASDKPHVLSFAASTFAANQSLDARKVLASLTARESLGSTALGQGVAIPHGRLRGLKHEVAAIFRLAKPVDFDSPDGRPVGLLIVLLVPEAATQHHLELLSELAQMLSDRHFRDDLMAAPQPAVLHARVTAWEPIRPAA